MQTPGERMKWTRLIQSDKYVVAVEVEVVLFADDPSDPCYEPETILLLDQIQQRADDGDVNWLRQHGVVYEAIGAAKRRIELRLSGRQRGLLTHAEKKRLFKARASKSRVSIH